MTHKILLIDDDPLVRKSVLLLLKRNDFEAKSAESVAQALQIAETEQFDLIISDIRMPGVDGVTGAETLSQLFRTKWEKDIPVVFITGYAGAGRELKAEVYGEIITKPFDLDFLITTIREYL